MKNNIKIYYKYEENKSIKLKPWDILENITPTEWERENIFRAYTLKGIKVRNVIINSYYRTLIGKGKDSKLPEIKTYYSKYILDFNRKLVIYVGEIEFITTHVNFYKKL